MFKKSSYDLSDVHPLLEILTVKENKRKLGRIEDFPENLNYWKKYAQYLGLVNTFYKRKISKTVFLLLAREVAVLEKARRFHAIEEEKIKRNEKRDELHSAFGYLYGYPECCVEYFKANHELTVKKDDLTLQIKTIKKENSGFFPLFVNNFIPTKFIFHHLCSYSCQKSLKIGKSNANLLENFNKELYQQVLAKNNLCLLLVGDQYLFLEKNNFSINDLGVNISLSALTSQQKKSFKLLRKNDRFKISWQDKKNKVFVFSL